MSEQGCKVCRVLDQYDMGQYEEQLVEQWQADGPGRKGYRQLAEWFNVLLLHREMDRAGLSTLGDEPKSKYQRLQSGESIAEEVAAELANQGVPINRIQDDFVSYGVIRTHLKDCLNEEVSISSGEWELETIEIARGHAKQKISEAIRSLRNKGELLAGGETRVSVVAEIECEMCHTRVPVMRAIRRGYVCDCEI